MFRLFTILAILVVFMMAAPDAFAQKLPAGRACSSPEAAAMKKVFRTLPTAQQAEIWIDHLQTKLLTIRDKPQRLLILESIANIKGGLFEQDTKIRQAAMEGLTLRILRTFPKQVAADVFNSIDPTVFAKYALMPSGTLIREDETEDCTCHIGSSPLCDYCEARTPCVVTEYGCGPFWLMSCHAKCWVWDT